MPATACAYEKPQARTTPSAPHVGAEEVQRRDREYDRGGERHQRERADERRPQRLDRLQIPRDRRAQVVGRAHFNCPLIFFIPRNARVFAALTRIPSRAAISTKLQPST